MVYMAADNNLSEMGGLNLEQMKSAPSSPDVNVVVQVERSPRYEPGQPGNTFRGMVRNGQAQLTDLGRNIDMTRPENLAEFVQWVKKNHPADHYVLDLWSHGGGWRAKAPVTKRGVLMDDSSNHGALMDVPALAEALRTAGGVDLLTFDACLMSMYEVAFTLKDTAKWMLGSEPSIPGFGLPYDKVLTRLVQAPDQDAVSLGKGMVKDYIDFYRGLGNPERLGSVQLSLLDLGKTMDLHGAMLQLATDLEAQLSSERLAIEGARDAAKDYDGYGGRDLARFADALKEKSGSTSLRASAQAAAAAARAMVVANDTYDTGTADPVHGSTGVAVWLPDPRKTSDVDLRGYDAQPSNQEAAVGAGRKSWGSFIRALVTGNSSPPGQTGSDGALAFGIVWDNPEVDLDLLINEPQGDWAGPSVATTSPNGFSSEDSWASGKPAEYYSTQNQLDAGHYDAFVQFAGCHKGYSTCGSTVVRLFRIDSRQGETDWVEIGQRRMDAQPALPDEAWASWATFIQEVTSNTWADWYYGGRLTRSDAPRAKAWVPHKSKNPQRPSGAGK